VGRSSGAPARVLFIRDPLSDRLARFNRRLFNPLVRTFAGRRGSPVAVVVHRGRRYRTPVLAFRADDGYVVALFYGADRDWVRNVLAAGSCTLQRGGRQVELTATRMLDTSATAWRWCRRRYGRRCGCCASPGSCGCRRPSGPAPTLAQPAGPASRVVRHRRPRPV
jgi:deazaflavin-dependent oxidoreductase (nitroreductase family)